MNTYLAGQNDSDAAFGTEGNGTVQVVDEQELPDDIHLLPGTLSLDTYTTDATPVDDVPMDGDRVDVSELTRTDVATLDLTEPSTGEATTAIAPEGADLGDASAVNDAAVSGDEITPNGSVIVSVDVSGIYGYLENVGENELGEDLTFTVNQTNADQYVSPVTLTAADSEAITPVPDAENDTLHFAINASAVEGIEAGQEYEATFTVEDSYEYADESQEATTSFSIVEPTIEITGEQDDQDRLQIAAGENATVTGDDGEATLELPHGEYTATVTVDGQESTAQLTVGDDTENATTVTVGQTGADGGTGGDDVGEGDEGADGTTGDGTDGADGSDGGDGVTGGDGGDGGDGGENQPGFGVIVALVALLAAAGIATRRRKERTTKPDDLRFPD